MAERAIDRVLRLIGMVAYLDHEEGATLEDIAERFGGRFGYSLDVRTETVYSEAETGTEVARKVTTMSQYNVAEAPNRGEQ